MNWHFELENIGGIQHAEAEITPGLNAVQASNWQGKSSFLEGIKTALGVSTQLTEGTTTGHVRYSNDEKSGVVTLRREDGSVQQTGTPILTDEYDLVRTRLFACLGEHNEIRHAVRGDGNLKDILLRPLDFENIDEQIQTLRHERNQVDQEIEVAEKAKKQLPNVQQKVTQIEQDIEKLEAERTELSEGSTAETSETAQNQLTELESEKTNIKNKITRLEDSIDRTESLLDTKREEFREISIPDEQPSDSQLETTRQHLQELKRDKKVLESVHSSIQMVLRENRLDLITDVTRQIDQDRIVCWTCGQETSRSTISEQVDQIGSKIAEVKTEIDQTQSDVEELEAKRERIKQSQNRRESLRKEISELEEKQSTDKQSIDSARERLADIEGEIETLSEQVDDSIEKRTDIESTLKYRRAELQDARDDLAQLEKRSESLDDLQTQRSHIADRISDLRERKERIQFQMRDQFDEAIQSIVPRFETGFESARLTSEFDLVVARDGRQTSTEMLSEGELELLGFAAALAGYRAFSVDELSPFILVDQVGGLAEQNLEILVDFLYSETSHLVFTSYPEYGTIDANAIDPDGWVVANS